MAQIMHHSIIRCDGKPPLECCTTCCRLFHCPICPKTIFKPTQPTKLHRHLEVHMKNATAFEDKKICRCNLDCRNTGHYHCPICEDEQQAEVSLGPAKMDTPVEWDSVEDRVLQDCRKAAEWVEANKKLFSGTVDLPDVLNMDEENQAEAVLQLRLRKDTEDEDERESILEPFKFIFSNIKDMLTFSEEIVDNLHYMAYCQCHTDDNF